MGKVLMMALVPLWRHSHYPVTPWLQQSAVIPASR
jgi:hypothetical protein